MAAAHHFSTQQVKHIAQLANLPVTVKEEQMLATAFDETLAVIANLSSLDTKNVEPIAQTTGLENVWRADVAPPDYSLSQEEALANASASAQGYFVVPRILHHDE